MPLPVLSGVPASLPTSQTKNAEAEVLASVGEGGFFPEEFELMQELGTINIQQASVLRRRAAAAGQAAPQAPPRVCACEVRLLAAHVTSASLMLTCTAHMCLPVPSRWPPLWTWMTSTSLPRSASPAPPSLPTPAPSTPACPSRLGGAAAGPGRAVGCEARSPACLLPAASGCAARAASG